MTTLEDYIGRPLVWQGCSTRSEPGPTSSVTIISTLVKYVLVILANIMFFLHLAIRFLRCMLLAKYFFNTRYGKSKHTGLTNMKWV